MRKYCFTILVVLYSLLFIMPKANAQLVAGRDTLLFFIKKEFNTGISLSVNSEREELRTEQTRNFEKYLREMHVRSGEPAAGFSFPQDRKPASF